MKEKRDYEPVVERAGYRGLSNAIVLAAVADYRRALTRYYGRRKDREAKDEIESLRRFFFSQWFYELCAIDGHWLVKKIEQECLKEGFKEKRYRTL